MMRYTRSSILPGNTGGNFGLPFLFLALPVMDEPDYLQQLLNCLAVQSYRRFHLYVCVNQPESWWESPEKIASCENNSESLTLLNEFSEFEITVIDRSSKGNGWTGKRHGVGYARKTVMDRINEDARPGDIMVSLDADTLFSENYLLSIARNFSVHSDVSALSVPYFHHVPSDPEAARAILHYEIYMRYYFLNLARIGSPYAFTALGSAMAVPVSAYRATGGMTPKLSGEDFYFLQKLRKYAPVMLWNEEVVHPAARFSDRVFFGTGPAMIRGAGGDWSSYPLYPMALFNDIRDAYDSLPVLFAAPADTKVGRFIAREFREADPFMPLRLNHKTLPGFIRAFHEKFDGLRILQYLKAAWEENPSGDENNLWKFLQWAYSTAELEKLEIDPETFSFSGSSIDELNRMRIFLYQKEMEVRLTAKPA
ncbi:MAG: glycosyltransferase [Bacteroidales bacterium]